jgi:hypothetical protein
MSKKNKKSSMKNTTKKVKRSLPKNISMNPSGSYRLRKTIDGIKLDMSFERLKDAKAFRNAQNWK